MCGEVGEIPNALYMLFVAESNDSNESDDDSVNNDHVKSGPNLDLTCPLKTFHQLGNVVGKGKNVIFKIVV
jgi:hypothetical protein